MLKENKQWQHESHHSALLVLTVAIKNWGKNVFVQECFVLTAKQLKIVRTYTYLHNMVGFYWEDDWELPNMGLVICGPCKGTGYRRTSTNNNKKSNYTKHDNNNNNNNHKPKRLWGSTAINANGCVRYIYRKKRNILRFAWWCTQSHCLLFERTRQKSVQVCYKVIETKREGRRRSSWSLFLDYKIQQQGNSRIFQQTREQQKTSLDKLLQ